MTLTYLQNQGLLLTEYFRRMQNSAPDSNDYCEAYAGHQILKMTLVGEIKRALEEQDTPITLPLGGNSSNRSVTIGHVENAVEEEHYLPYSPDTTGPCTLRLNLHEL